MKLALLLTTMLSLTACGAAAPLAVGGIGIVTGISATTNIPAVEKFGDDYLSTVAKEGK